MAAPPDSPRSAGPRSGSTFDPGAPAAPDSGLFGLGSSAAEAAVHVLPVPFDATASYGKGAALGPAAILRASHQVDLFDPVTGRPYEAGVWMAPSDGTVEAWNAEATAAAQRGDGGAVDATMDALNAWVGERTEESLAAGKLVATLGGDHSVPFAAIAAHAARYPGMGILHVDAHADLRDAYEGFAWSHASILHNVLTRIDGLGPIVQVGLRDLCEEEFDRIGDAGGALRALFDHEWAAARLAGRDLGALVRRTIEPLPAEVYVTFDVDGLDPALCPNTGTPVPGGLTWHEAMLWLSELVRSGRRIVGLDLCEVAGGPEDEPDRWDAVVGARLLYRMIGFALQGRRSGP